MDEKRESLKLLNRSVYRSECDWITGMDIPEEMGMLSDHVVTPDDLSAGKTLREMHLPHGIRVMMVKREGKFLVPHGSMELMEGDHLIIVMGESDD